MGADNFVFCGGAEGDCGPAWAAEARSRVESGGAGGGTHRELVLKGGPYDGI